VELIADPRLAPAFAPVSKAEVSTSWARLDRAPPPALVSGQIEPLVSRAEF